MYWLLVKNSYNKKFIYILTPIVMSGTIVNKGLSDFKWHLESGSLENVVWFVSKSKDLASVLSQEDVVKVSAEVVLDSLDNPYDQHSSALAVNLIIENFLETNDNWIVWIQENKDRLLKESYANLDCYIEAGDFDEADITINLLKKFGESEEVIINSIWETLVSLAENPEEGFQTVDRVIDCFLKQSDKWHDRLISNQDKIKDAFGKAANVFLDRKIK